MHLIYCITAFKSAKLLTTRAICFSPMYVGIAFKAWQNPHYGLIVHSLCNFWACMQTAEYYFLLLHGFWLILLCCSFILSMSHKLSAYEISTKHIMLNNEHIFVKNQIFETISAGNDGQWAINGLQENGISVILLLPFYFTVINFRDSMALKMLLGSL